MSNSHPAALYHLRKVTRIFALIIIALIVIGFFLPIDYRVEREVTINAPVDEVSTVMLQGDSLSKWMFVKNGQVDVFDGSLKAGSRVAISYSEKVGQGELTIVDLSGDSVRFDVRPKPNVNLVHNQIFLRPSAGKTSVQWVIEGKLEAGLLGPYIAVFANQLAGKNFEISLQRLKELLETRH
ncbi:SRPBCC family protein [Marinomonas transparens]|uniref:SRPBCC family protein n=1 Tax=Marinomonas transparens TaxID=2795388 RepID=UPI002D7EF878|nr:SRPBCC family protein [Marinomonas transparens]